VPTDFSPPSAEAWRAAQQLARSLGAELVLLHVFVEGVLYGESPFTGPQVRAVYESARVWAEETLKHWADEARVSGLEVWTELRTGVPYEGIVSAAAEDHADLIVIGTRGRGGIGRTLLGSVADRVIRLAPCPVLSVRPAADSA
jgi:nucleotide-binding universal stress UspA family protein